MPKIITIMLVTKELALPAGPSPLSEETQLSIDLAIAQWMRGPRATSIARQRLRNLGVSEAEIECRRRCRSNDPVLAGILRLAVTLLIAHGRLEETDLRRVKPAPSAALLRAVVAAVALAFYNVAIAESVERTAYAAIDMRIGDY